MSISRSAIKSKIYQATKLQLEDIGIDISLEENSELRNVIINTIRTSIIAGQIQVKNRVINSINNAIGLESDDLNDFLNINL